MAKKITQLTLTTTPLPDDLIILEDVVNGQTKAITYAEFQATVNELSELTDVNITSISDGQFLKWDNATSKWLNIILAESDISDLDKYTQAETDTLLDLKVDTAVLATVVPANETDPVFLASEAFDFEAGDKNKLDGIETGADVNNISDINATDLTDGGDTTLHDHDGISENTAHRGLVTGNPHDVTKIEVGLSNVPNIDCTDASNISSGILPSAVLPPVALISVQVAVSEVAMLALTTEEGDVVVRSDENKSYMRNVGTAGTMADFTELQTPTDSVLSVNGETGTVILTTGDIGEDANYRFMSDAQETVLNNTSNTNTGDQDLSPLALKSNVLELDNISAFTPDTDYEPATKKYVDDNAGGDSPVTTKGDLFTYDTAIARLGVGANGEVLTVDSGEATGLKWAVGGGGASQLSDLSDVHTSTPTDKNFLIADITEQNRPLNFEVELLTKLIVRYEYLDELLDIIVELYGRYYESESDAVARELVTTWDEILSNNEIEGNRKKKQALVDHVKTNYKDLETGDVMDQEDVELIVDKVLTCYFSV